MGEPCIVCWCKQNWVFDGIKLFVHIIQRRDRSFTSLVISNKNLYCLKIINKLKLYQLASYKILFESVDNAPLTSYLQYYLCHSSARFLQDVTHCTEYLISLKLSGGLQGKHTMPNFAHCKILLKFLYPKTSER